MLLVSQKYPATIKTIYKILKWKIYVHNFWK